MAASGTAMRVRLLAPAAVVIGLAVGARAADAPPAFPATIRVEAKGARPGGVRHAPDVSALASRDFRRVAILAWHCPDDNVAGPAADVRLESSGLPARVRGALLTHSRVDLAPDAMGLVAVGLSR